MKKMISMAVLAGFVAIMGLSVVGCEGEKKVDAKKTTTTTEVKKEETKKP